MAKRCMYGILSAFWLLACGVAPANAQYDSFDLPPGVENTRIPKKLPSVLHPYAPPAKKADAPPEPDDSVAYSLKEFKLGMSLDDFSKVVPAGTDPKKVKSVCSCEPGQTLERITEEDQKAKVIVCGFWNKEGDELSALPYRMTVAGLQASPDFRFIEDGGIYRLFEISLTFYSSNFNDMRAALVRKYGEPPGKQTDKVQTESGDIILASYLIWDNGVSRIRLGNVDGNNVGRAKLRYLHRRLATSYSSRIAAQQATPVKRASDDL